ncbi:MAG: aspartyl protease family protein [Candidatus Aenigmarchaeota archaeon]|nr:aspartyl protease family protein [Candidatus Aenigmarchaeota archaeon]
MPEFFHYKLIKRPKPLEPAKTPTIEIRLIGKNIIDFIAIVDSGSDCLIMPKNIAETLELKIGNNQKEVLGLGGKVKGTPINVEGSIKYEHRRINMVIHTLVVDSELPILIGRKDFFERFEVTINERKRTVKLKDLGKI